jgi:NifU-like protein involved in Fe-S cluster formation
MLDDKARREWLETKADWQLQRLGRANIVSGYALMNRPKLLDALSVIPGIEDTPDRNSDIYTERLLSYWTKEIPPALRADFEGEATNKNCNDRVRYKISETDGVIDGVTVHSYGCCITECAANMLAELILGTTPTNAMTEQAWFDFVNIRVPVGRRDCVMVPLWALKEAFNACDA